MASIKIGKWCLINFMRITKIKIMENKMIDICTEGRKICFFFFMLNFVFPKEIDKAIKIDLIFDVLSKFFQTEI